MPNPITHRLLLLDALRGFAIAWMTIYHFCFDLNHFGWIHQNFYDDPFWTLQRNVILSLFLFCVGWSQAVRMGASKEARNKGYWQSLMEWRFWKRWLQIVGCAALVSVGSFAMFGERWIYFGTLHAIATAVVILHFIKPWFRQKEQAVFAFWGFLGLSGLLWGLWYVRPAVWNDAPLNLLGLISLKPPTEDYVPLLPWLGVVLMGYAFGLCPYERRKQKGKGDGKHSVYLNALAALGRWSLPYYMLHQPVVMGLMTLLGFLTHAS